MKCQRCDSEMEERTFESFKQPKKIFHCNNCGFECCPHIGSHPNNFSCTECDSPVEQCDCFDCSIFCSQCNMPVWGCSCSDVVMAYNKTQPKQVC